MDADGGVGFVFQSGVCVLVRAMPIASVPTAQ